MIEQGQKTGLTYELCEFLSNSRFADLSADAVHAGRRGLIDWIGCVFAGSVQPSVDILLCVLQPVGGREVATVMGRRLKLGLLEAPIVNGYMGHALDYDDTHTTTLHPSSPVLSALFALCEERTFTGQQFLLAYACGLEFAVRAARSAPAHHKGGWHLTGTLGTLGAAAGAGKLLGLDPRKLTHAIGIAGSQAAGLQQNRGTMPKYLHAGKAASSGILSALLAERGFDASLEVMEGVRGFSRIYSEVAQPERLTEALGQPWEITRNGFKPYASAVVLHPIVDAMIEIRKQDPDLAKVTSIDLSIHPYVQSITGVMEPRSGMQSKFSLSHTAAVGLFDGAGGVAAYSDERVMHPEVKALREKVRYTIDESLAVDQVRAKVAAAGRTYEAFIEHQTGTIVNPMSDGQIEEKFKANAEPVIGTSAAKTILELAWSIDRADDVRTLITSCA